MKNYRNFRIIALLFASILVITACDREIDETPIPFDGNPAIALVDPTNNNFLDTIGGQVTATFRLDDNEALKVFRVVGRILNQRDSLVGVDFIVQEDTVSGQHITQTLTYTVPSLPLYYKVRLTCYSIDSEGKFASVVLYVSVVPSSDDPATFSIEEYNGDKIYSQLALNGRGFFDFNSRNYIDNLLDKDIQELTSVPGPFLARLESPNNAFLGQDSVFVMTDATQFNYDAATYETIHERFFSDPAPSSTTPALTSSDIVIVRLTNTPHFAVMKIIGVNDGPGDAQDYIEFDYKVTY